MFSLKCGSERVAAVSPLLFSPVLVCFNISQLPLGEVEAQCFLCHSGLRFDLEKEEEEGECVSVAEDFGLCGLACIWLL